MLEKKRIITSVFCAVFTMLTATTSHSQNWAGTYKTDSDYAMNKLTDRVALDSKKNKIRIGSFERLVLKSEGKKIVYKPGELFGFFDGTHHFRYYKGKGPLSEEGYFTIRETSGMLLYL
jgi:hypothetical protein